MKVEIEWIPCAERLPDADERVLIFADGDVWGATYEEADEHDVAHWVCDSAGVIATRYVTHWAQMPEGPAFVPTGAGGNARAFICCEGVGAHAAGCTAAPASESRPVCRRCGSFVDSRGKCRISEHNA